MRTLTWFSKLHFLYREKRSTLAEIVEQLQEREAAQVWTFVDFAFHPNTVFANSHSIYLYCIFNKKKTNKYTTIYFC